MPTQPTKFTMEVGKTHDGIIWMNNSQAVGLVFAPFTYRANIAPTFIPAFAVGAPSGVDESRWKTFDQARFDGGGGQIYLSAEMGNNRYAESNGLDIGLPVTVIGGLAGRDDPLTAAATPGGPLDDDPVGDLQAALRPLATTAETPLGELFTNAHPVHVLELSQRPHVFHNKSAMVYTNLSGPDVWKDGVLGGSQNPLSGNWVVIDTQLPAPVVSAVRFSGQALVSFGDDDRLQIYGSTDGTSPARLYTPQWASGGAGQLGIFDGRIWIGEADFGRVKYFDPTQDIYSASTPLGSFGLAVNNMRGFAGKYYFGKPDSLWVFDAGRTYEVEDFRDETDPNNFKMMVVHRGNLYFNIKQKLYRISSNNLIELLQTPRFNGTIVDGASVGGELYFLTRDSSGEGNVYIFNTETGGTRQWFGTKDLAIQESNKDRGPASLQGALGHVWLAPMYTSEGGLAANSIMAPIAAVNRLQPSLGIGIPKFMKTHAYMMMSMLDFGIPDVNKELHKVIVDYTLYSPNDRIDVFWIDALRGAHLKSAHYHDGSFTDHTAALRDGDADTEVINADTANGDFLYLGFPNRPEAIRMILGGNTVVQTITYEYWNGAWTTIPGVGDETVALTKSGFIILPDLPDWIENTVNGYTAFHVRYTFNVAAHLEVNEVNGIASLRNQAWKSLGTVDSLDDVRQELFFPNDTTAYEIMIKLVFWSTDSTRPDVRRIKIKYAAIGSPYLDISASVMAVDNLELLNVPYTENSLLFIQASLYSMASAGKTYVTSLPWPEPVGTTRDMRVNIASPGGFVPALPYDNTHIPAMIPIRLEEM